MLRHSISRLSSTVTRQSTCSSRRTVTSKGAKRALNKSQLSGESTTAKPKPPPPPAPTTAKIPPTPPPPSSSSDSYSGLIVPIVGAVVVAGGGLAYYNGWLPFDQPQQQSPKETTPEKKEPEKKTETKNKASPESTVKSTTKKEPPKTKVDDKGQDKTTSSNAATAKKKEKPPPPPTPEGNQVRSIVMPKGTGRDPPQLPDIVHPESGHRVTMEPPVSRMQASVDSAVKELKASNDEETDVIVKRAHQALRANMDESLFQDLEQLRESELRVRVVQLATELKERTKWEAVRLKEFLSMKEKETSEKYMELMQKQRLEFEETMARGLREQEDVLTRQANAALQKKDDGIQALLKAASDAQEAEHQAQLESTKNVVETKLKADHEIKLANALAEEKKTFFSELEAKVATIRNFDEKIKQLQSALDVTQSFQSGSLEAHRISAAALALTEKLESNADATLELNALKNVSGENPVIAAAIAPIGNCVKNGVPTLSELQTKFESIHTKTRQAALVPEGRVGLGGHLVGMALSSIKYAPNPDAVAPEESKNDAEYCVARARKHVQLGDLERAVGELDKLSGLAAFTVKDWKQNASDRVAVDKALHVVKVECALLNKSLSD